MVVVVDRGLEHRNALWSVTSTKSERGLEHRNALWSVTSTKSERGL
jgi:hypothetical protein